MNQEEIYARLGFLPPEEMRRRSGRTTEMLVAAVEEALKGECVWISAYDKSYQKELVRRARNWVEECGGNPVFVNPLWNNSEAPTGLTGKVFRDHFRGEKR